jgi:copper transport protein
LAILLGGGLALPRAVTAHSLLQSSNPAAGSTVAVAPPAVTLVFGEAPDPSLSTVKVLDTSGQDVAAGPAVGVAGHPEQLQVPLGTLPSGVYTVAWRTVSKVDGHTTAGSFAFGVGVSPSTDTTQTTGGTTSPNGSVGDTLSRFLMYLGLFGMLGAAFVGFAVHPRPPRVLIRLGAVSWALFGIGTVGVVAFQVVDAGTGLGNMLGSSLGVGVVARGLSIAVTGAAVLVAVRQPLQRRWIFATIGAAAAASMLVDVLNGHAAAGDQPLVDIGLQWTHIMASGLWMGGLAALLLSVTGTTDAAKEHAVRRFSRWAGFALGATAITGFLRALGEVQTVDALLGTDFGRLVLVKSLGLLGLAGLGAFNHFVSVPAAVRTLRPLRLVGRVELSAGAMVLLATGLLVNLAPPSSRAASEPQPKSTLSVVGADFGTTIRASLTVTPGTPGLNQFAVAVTDYDTGDPVSVRGVTLRFDPASASGVGRSRLELKGTGPGEFSASGGNLSLDDIWNITAVISETSGAVEIPLAIATSLADQVVDTNAIPGAPTIFTAHLPRGTSLQVYLDPGRAGANELHATFFDASANELPVQTANVLVTAAGVEGAIEVPRQLEPGHFVLDLRVNEGPLVADVAGAAPDGTFLHGHFEIPLQP